MADFEAELVESPNRQPQADPRQSATCQSATCQSATCQSATCQTSGLEFADDHVTRIAESARQEPTVNKVSQRRNRSLLLGLAVGGGLGICTLCVMTLGWLAWNSKLNPWSEYERGSSVAASKVSNLFEQDVLQIQQQIVEAKRKIESAKAEHDALEQEKTALELEIKDLEAKTKL